MSKMPVFDPTLACKPLFSGETRRDIGMATVVDATNDATKDWLHATLDTLCQFYSTITSDDLWTVIDGLQKDSDIRLDIERHPNIIGSVFRKAAIDGKIKDSGAASKTLRENGQARRIVTWEVVR